MVLCKNNASLTLHSQQNEYGRVCAGEGSETDFDGKNRVSFQTAGRWPAENSKTRCKAHYATIVVSEH